MRIQKSLVATVALAVGALAPVAVTAGDRPSPSPQQSARDARKIVNPTWKTFSTTTSRGTRIAVSTGGNITQYTSPNVPGARYEHIGVGALSEGYVLCYSGARAYDLGESASGFAAPTTSASGVVRRTSDGRVQLSQQFKLITGSPTAFEVIMSLKNISGAPLSGVVLRRQVDFDIDTGGDQGWAGYVSNHSRTRATVSAFHDPAEAPAGKESHGIMLAVQKQTGSWYTRVTDGILPSDCDPAAAPLDANFISRGDYGDTIGFPIGSIAPGQTKTVSVRYMRY